jgi:hypothetical protein
VALVASATSVAAPRNVTPRRRGRAASIGLLPRRILPRHRGPEDEHHGADCRGRFQASDGPNPACTNAAVNRAVHIGSVGQLLDR